MSIRYSRLASRSFIIGSRLWPPATSRAVVPEPLQQPDRVVDAGGALVLERCREPACATPSGVAAAARR